MRIHWSVLVCAAGMLAGCAGVSPQSAANALGPTQAVATAQQPAAATTAEPTTAPAASATAEATTKATAAPATAAPEQAATSAATAAPAAPTAAPAATAAFGSEILYLHQGMLVAYNPERRTERKLIDGVQTFSALPDGSQIAVLRSEGDTANLFVLNRDGSDLRQLTNNNGTRQLATPSFAPDGMSIVYASSSSSDPYTREWPQWASWCSTSQIELINIVDGSTSGLGAGCDPSFAPDGRRIAFAAPPAQSDPALNNGAKSMVNSIRLVNRQGKNGWDFATASGPGNESGMVVYAPAWSPDSGNLAYNRFVGYQSLVDVTLTEIGKSFQGNGKLLADGAGWQLPPRFSPDAQQVVVIENNYSDARGLTGYDTWGATLLQLNGSHDVMLPAGTANAVGTLVESVQGAQAVAWSPDGGRIATLLPPGWAASRDVQQPFGVDEGAPGDLWLWQPGSGPQERLLEGAVDYASPLAWLPVANAVERGETYQLVYPSSWALAGPTEFEERTATGPTGALISVAPSGVSDLQTATAEDMFGFFVAAGAKNEAPITWPDGSVYREWSGTTPEGAPAAGATRVMQTANGDVFVVLYRTTPERWPLERAEAQTLLAQAGPAN